MELSQLGRSHKYMKNIILFLFVIISFCFFGLEVSASTFAADSGLGETGWEAGYMEANLADDTLPQIIGNVIRTILLFIGVFFLILTIYAGFIWMFSRGNSDQVEKAKKILQNAFIGLIVVLLAYAITYFIANVLTTVPAPESVP